MLFLSLSMVAPLSAQKFPIGYIQQFSHKGNNDSFFSNFSPEKPELWSINTDKNQQCLKITTVQVDSASIYPLSRGVFHSFIFGDFIIEFEFLLDPLKSGDLTFLGPVKTANTYYAFDFLRDSIHFQFWENGAIVREKKVAIKGLKPLWNKCRIERDILGRKTNITLNGDVQHKIIFTDKNLVMGYLGFGANGESFLRNITVYAPTSITDKPFNWF